MADRVQSANAVGLGQTIQAVLLLRQAWLAGRAKRILILAPKAVLKQWQIELREKFNLNWPNYDEGKLACYAASASRQPRPVSVAVSTRRVADISLTDLYSAASRRFVTRRN